MNLVVSVFGMLMGLVLVSVMMVRFLEGSIMKFVVVFSLKVLEWLYLVCFEEVIFMLNL